MLTESIREYLRSQYSTSICVTLQTDVYNFLTNTMHNILNVGTCCVPAVFAHNLLENQLDTQCN